MRDTVYIAGPYAARDHIRERCVPVFEKAGFEVVSRWLYGTREITAGTVGTAPARSAVEVRKAARKDLEEVDKADLFVLLSPSYVAGIVPGLEDELLKSSGRHVEFGYALSNPGIVPVVVGEPENIFGRSLPAVVLGTPEAVTDWWLSWEGEA